jgi:hypothetical protein
MQWYRESAFNQKRVFNRILALVMAELFAFGRHTITQLLLTLGLTEEDWSGWYRLFSYKRFDEEKTAKVMLTEMIAEVAEAEPFVVGADGFHVPRCSQKMPGTGWMRGLNTAKFKPGIQRGQRFVEGSWFTPIVNGYSRAIPHPVFKCLHGKSSCQPRRESYRSERRADFSTVDTATNGHAGTRGTTFDYPE